MSCQKITDMFCGKHCINIQINTGNINFFNKMQNKGAYCVFYWKKLDRE